MSPITPREPAIERSMSRRAPAIVVRANTLVAGPVRVDAAVASASSPRHDVNEDAHSALDGHAAVFVVADGVGGGAMASWASRTLVARLHGALDGVAVDERAMCDALVAADHDIARTIATQTDRFGAATVVLCAAIDVSFAQWLVAWVGDCRAYRVRAARDAQVELLTVDDTYRHLAELPPAGGSLDDPARMVGNGAVGAPNVRLVDLGRGDMLLLASDGVHKHASAQDIGRLMRATSPLARRCARLVDVAHASGGNDDATALVVRRDDRHRTERLQR